MLRKFELDLLPKVELETTEIDGKRYYLTPDGTFPSVTTVLGERLDDGWYDKWVARVGAEEARKVGQQAATRGTAIHDIAEKYLLGEDYREGQMPVNLMTFESIKGLLDAHVTTVYGIEFPLWSKKLNTAGRTDLIADFGGRTSIVDFKTSKRLKKESDILSYFLQATCYSMMVEARTKKKVDRIAILIAVDHEPPQLFMKFSEEYRDRVIDIFTQK